MRRMNFALLSAAAMLMPVSAQATTAIFDFEDQAATFDPNGARVGALSTLSLTNNGLTITITRQNANFDIVSNTDAQGGKGPEFGDRSLDPFFVSDTNSNPFVVNFSTAATALSMDIGDYGGDSDVATINLYSGLNGTGTLLGTGSVDYDDGFFPDFATVSASSPTGFLSAVFVGGSSDFTNSVFYDNFNVTFADAVPEASGWATTLLGLGLAGGAMRLRARRSTAAVAA